ncbi:MAG: hypothetical protein M3O28_08615 [Actinomycetota bacterium]|nr:hypothetical protein [Actinomycetota bacterium]
MEPTINRSSAPPPIAEAMPKPSDHAELLELRRRRAELRESMGTLERELAAAAADRAVVWGERVYEALSDLADDFVDHIAVTEGPDGLHQAILGGDLRLTNGVNALAADHQVIAAEIASLIADTQPPVSREDVAAVRAQATELLGHLVRHRQRGADLIYEAYDTDIGGGD